MRMRERKCSFRREALGRVRGLDPKKVDYWFNGLGLIGPVRNIAPTREMNVFIRFPSSLDEFPTAVCMAPALSFFFRLLMCQTVCGMSLRFSFVDVAERVVTFARFSKERVVGAVFEIPVIVPSLILAPV
ncbi:hypothetical protein PIB30_066985 [Stylosanthes scabra]|uniref:Uncharacterized protein n=1 Tax=Stylosanthes scabra TaxID=79078 RepID=A0ABU6QME4_9FABA|nr:hypothetical protein [Stylosanthes scabra]